jgi:hypothetical protein
LKSTAPRVRCQQKHDGLARIQAAIIHAVMRPAEPREIVGRIVSTVVIEVRDSHRMLRPGDGAAFKRGCLAQNAAGVVVVTH